MIASQNTSRTRFMLTLTMVFIALDVSSLDMESQECSSGMIIISFLLVKVAIFISFRQLVISTALWREQVEVAL